MAAALTYYTLISVAPLLIILLTLAGFFFGPEQGAGKVASGLAALVGPEGVALLDRWVHRAGGEASRWFATMIGLGIVFYGSTRVFSELRRTLRVIWGFPVRMSKRARLLDILRANLISFLMVVGIGLLVLAGILSSTIISAIGTFLNHRLPEALELARLIHSTASVALLGLSLVLVYRFLPGKGVRWRDVWGGALLAAILLTLGQRALGFYLGNTTIRSLYGAAGSVVVTLFWFYYSWMIFFFGAEFTKARSRLNSV
jgi:membrane protein